MSKTKPALKGLSRAVPATEGETFRASLLMDERLYDLMNRARYLSGIDGQDLLIAGLERVLDKYESE